MATPQSLESLKILAGKGMGQRVLPTEEFGFGGRIPTQGELESPFELEQSRRAAGADERDRAAVSRIQATNAGIDEYNRPEVMEIRQTEEKNALEKLLAPIRLKGQYDVEAAKQNQLGTQQRDERLFGQKTALASGADAGKNARLAAAEKSRALREQYKLLATDKTSPSVGFFQGMVPGARNSAKQKALADLQAQIDALDVQGAEPEVEDVVGAAPLAAAAPTSGTSAAELLARRRARGR